MKIKLAITILCAFTASICHSYQIDCVDRDTLLNSSSIKWIDQEVKIYIDESQITIAEEGIRLFLNEEGDYLPLTHIHRDAKGSYITRDSVKCGFDIQIHECPYCHSHYSFFGCKTKGCKGQWK